jgi:hypothetical protein
MRVGLYAPGTALAASTFPFLPVSMVLRDPPKVSIHRSHPSNFSENTHCQHSHRQALAPPWWNAEWNADHFDCKGLSRPCTTASAVTHNSVDAGVVSQFEFLDTAWPRIAGRNIDTAASLTAHPLRVENKELRAVLHSMFPRFSCAIPEVSEGEAAAYRPG